MNIYPDNFDAVAKKCAALGYEGLDPKEQLVYCLWWLEGELNNGGFDQFFFNSSGNFTEETMEALVKIGASKTKELLETACQVAFFGPAPKSQVERQEALESGGEQLMGRLDELDQEFYEYQDDLAQLLNAYISADGT